MNTQSRHTHARTHARAKILISSLLQVYVRRVVDQIDVCDVISLYKTRAVLIQVFLLVARPNCYVVKVLSYMIYFYFYTNTQSKEHHAIDLLEERGVESWHEAFDDLPGKAEKQPVSVRTNTGTLEKLLTGEMALSA